MFIRKLFLNTRFPGWKNIFWLTIFIILNSLIWENHQRDLKSTSQTNQNQLNPKPFTLKHQVMTIGMTDNEVLRKLGKPILVNHKDFYYGFSENEQAYIRFDENRQVQVIVSMYSEENGKISKFADIFGANPLYHQSLNSKNFYSLKYPERGYSLTYHRLGGDQSATTVTMEKFPNPEIIDH